MTTIEHPKEPFSKQIITYDLVSTSPAKLKYSFGGLNNRFAKIKKPITQVVGYDLPTTKTKKTCSFGIGERFASTSPGRKRTSVDTFYEVPSVFNVDNTTSTFANHMNGTTFCFGAGRDDLKKQVLHPKNLGPDKLNPGPGTYQALLPIGSNCRSMKFKSRLTFGDPE